MKAIRISEHGGGEALQTVDLPDAPGAPGTVPVRVSHVGLNHLDVWVRRGVPGHRFPLPLIPGSDVVGVREDTGDVVTIHPAIGCMACEQCLSGRHDLCRRYRIRGEGMDGGMCERIHVSEAELLPCTLPPEQAAGVPLSLLTAWHMLVGRARLEPGDRVLVQAGASGVGVFAIQVARLCGAQVVATASTEAKRSLCLDLGAVAAWPYEEAAAEARAWTRKEGIDVVVDHVGSATWETSMRALKWGGTYVTCGATTGHEAPLNLRVLFFKQLDILGSTMGSMGEMEAAWKHVMSGAIRPVTDRVLPMTRLAEAHAALEDRLVAGKVVVEQDLA